MSGIAAIHAHMQLQHAAACRRRRRTAPWAFTGNHYLTSDGSAGSYARAATNAAARLILPGSTLGTASVAFWMRDALVDDAGHLVTAVASTGSNSNRCYVAVASLGTLSAAAMNNAGVTSAGPDQASLDASTWTLAVGTWEHGASDIVGVSHAGAARTTATDASPDTFDAGEVFNLFSGRAANLLWAGDIRSPGVFSRALTDAEIAALHTLGPTHDLREASGDYLGDVAHWWPADGDTGTLVTDRGVVGGCNLTLNGAVTIAEVA